MSTTDPSAAKSDGFAIGSISKRDRSGSGDEAAPVYPVKHPTMSYAGAAKGRPAAQSSNLFNYYSTSNSKNYQKNQQNPTKQQKNVKNQKPGDVPISLDPSNLDIRPSQAANQESNQYLGNRDCSMGETVLPNCWQRKCSQSTTTPIHRK
ncbi:hypothetical protein BB560_000554 [Smittium megazygosporum]|uniref:Uncharacterized protein n=1 Tax=Smittium megazygosporum TaxID=133381 RepID=A0A2T9ZK13_9FUNG|nr:hypothetical protein BB560_000554 [Smittium megazygosporum]